LPAFPTAPNSTFRLLNKLDLAFASLLQGSHVETGEPLPGFAGGRAVSGTEKVRIKSLVDQTRICVVNVFGAGDGTEVDNDLDDPGDVETEDEWDDMGDDNMTDIDKQEMGIARVYDRTVVELGDVLGGTPIGIVFDQ
jgi:Subunit 11 of the general transcription factor TFIIH